MSLGYIASVVHCGKCYLVHTLVVVLFGTHTGCGGYSGFMFFVLERGCMEVFVSSHCNG